MQQQAETDVVQEVGRVNIAAIREAGMRISVIVPPTPIKQSIYFESRSGLRTIHKLENLNISGSFKIRGAANAMLQLPQEKLAQGVICSSAGNHAQGVAHVARRLQTKASIFMSKRASLVKVEATRNLGGAVFLRGETYDDSYQEALRFQEEHGGTFVHPFADAQVICGQGSIGLEILDQVPDLGLVLVSIGGGGMASGIACAIKEQRPDVIVIGVETVQYPAMKLSRDAGKIIRTETRPSIADGISVKQVSPVTLAITNRYLDDILLISEESIASAIMDLMERDHILAEGAGAITAAALLELPNHWRQKLGSRSAVCVISGGNIDVNLFLRIATQGIIHSGRMMRLTIAVKDRPGSLADLLEIVGDCGANLLEVRHNRLFGNSLFEEVEVELDLETANKAQQAQIQQALSQAGFRIKEQA